jgi:hypothetical protein
MKGFATEPFVRVLGAAGQFGAVNRRKKNQYARNPSF